MVPGAGVGGHDPDQLGGHAPHVAGGGGRARGRGWGRGGVRGETPKSGDTVETRPVTDTRHEGQRPGVKTQDICLHSERRNFESPVMAELTVQQGSVHAVQVATVPQHGRHVAGGTKQARV